MCVRIRVYLGNHVAGSGNSGTLRGLAPRKCSSSEPSLSTRKALGIRAALRSFHCETAHQLVPFAHLASWHRGLQTAARIS